MRSFKDLYYQCAVAWLATLSFLISILYDMRLIRGIKVFLVCKLDVEPSWKCELCPKIETDALLPRI